MSRSLLNCNAGIIYIRILILFVILTAPLFASAQKVEPVHSNEKELKKNTELTISLLNMLKPRVDSSIKRLIITGDVLNDSRFEKFARKNNIKCFIMQGISCNGHDPAKGIHIIVSSAPYRASVYVGIMQLDGLGNVIETHRAGKDDLEILNYDEKSIGERTPQ